LGPPLRTPGTGRGARAPCPTEVGTYAGSRGPRRSRGVGMHKLVGGVVAAIVLALSGTAPALAAHGGRSGGGGGGGTPAPSPTPAGTPAVSITPAAVDFGAQALGTTSAPRT